MYRSVGLMFDGMGRIVKGWHCDKGSLLLHLIITLPLLASLIWLVLPAIGIHPGLNYFQPGFDAFYQLLAEPGILTSLAISFGTATLATLCALIFALAIIVHLPPDRLVALCRPWLAFMLSLPYLTVVLGIQFLISPSGLLTRLGAPVFGWSIPPPIQTVPDAWNIGYIAVVVTKETGFILMLVIAQLNYIPIHRYYKLGKSFGYSMPSIWLKIFLPLIYPKIRLGLWVLFVFAATNVEIALFASPNSSPPFSIRVWEWFVDPALETQLLASTAALLFLFLVLAVLAGYWLIERCIEWLGQQWFINSKRGVELAEMWSLIPWYLLLALHAVPFICMLIWSVSVRWSFPDIFPSMLSMTTLFRVDVFRAMANTVLIGSLVASVSVVCVIAFSELSKRSIQLWQVGIFYAPLIVPQVGMIFGLYVMILMLDINGTIEGIVIAQLLFVMPYCFMFLPMFGKALMIGILLSPQVSVAATF